MKRILIILLLAGKMVYSQSADTLTVFQCLKAVESYFPKSKEKQLVDEQTELELENIRSGWYPQMDFKVQATYQSDVIEVGLGNGLPFPVDFPTPSRDQYQATLDVNQLIWDGGSTRSSGKIQKLNSRAQRKSVDVELHKIKQQVSNVYFGILLLKKQYAILENTMDELGKKEKTIQAGVENGTLLPSDLKTVKAEKLRLEQNLEEVHRKIEASRDILRELTGIQMGPERVLRQSELEIESSEIQRPENELFSVQENQLEANRELIKSQKRPKIRAFGQLGYGQPGLNMLSEDFSHFYIVGARLSWNLWDWNQNKRKRQVVQVQQQMVDVQRKTFNTHVSVQLKNIRADIDNYRASFKRDKQIIALRQEVVNSARSKLENGVITSSDFISDLNELKNARLTYEKHRIEWVRAKMNYILTSGNL